MTLHAHEIKLKRDENDDKVAYRDVSRVDFIINKGEDQTFSHYFCNHWTKATTERLVKLGNLEESLVVLVDYGSEINLISNELYEM